MCPSPFALCLKEPSFFSHHEALYNLQYHLLHLTQLHCKVPTGSFLSLQVRKLRLREVRGELGALEPKAQFLFIVLGCREESIRASFRSCSFQLNPVLAGATSLCPGRLVGSWVTELASALSLSPTGHFSPSWMSPCYPEASVGIRSFRCQRAGCFLREAFLISTPVPICKIGTVGVPLQRGVRKKGNGFYEALPAYTMCSVRAQEMAAIFLQGQQVLGGQD